MNRARIRCIDSRGRVLIDCSATSLMLRQFLFGPYVLAPENYPLRVETSNCFGVQFDEIRTDEDVES